MNRRIISILILAVLILGYPFACGYAVESKGEISTTMIRFIHVPDYGSVENLVGKVRNVNHGDYVVVVYIMVDGGWWIKPYWDEPLTDIQADGSWVCDIATGGIDETATSIVAYLVPSDYKPYLAAGIGRLPKEIDECAVAKAEASRSSSDKRILLVYEPQPKQTPNIGISNTKIINGFCYGPFREKENPEAAIFPTASEISVDMKLIPKLTSTIRTYGCTGTLATIPDYCETSGIECYVGAWLGRYGTVNEKEIESVIAIANKKLTCVKGLIVGNEVLLRNDLHEEELIAYIRKVRSATDIPVTTAEIWSIWQNHPRLVKEVDFIMVHIHPYWESVPIGISVQSVLEHWKSLKEQFPNKKIVIGETGWPSDGQVQGEAVPSAENQVTFFRKFTSIAKEEKIDYFYFEIFDERWKDVFEGGAGGYWGIFNSNGSIKGHMEKFIPQKATVGIHRPPRKLEKIKVTVPFFVYKDADSDENGFYPSGWMGDLECIQIDNACTFNPHSGTTCISIRYDIGRSSRIRLLTDRDGHPIIEHMQSSSLWSGVYWQFPLNNWGDYPGYELVGAAKLTFWAHGQNGGEKMVFKCGGIRDSNKPYEDSFGPVQKVVELTKEWTKYTLDISDQNTKSVIGGFCWTASILANLPSTYFVQSQSCVIYLDDIIFEGDEGL